MSTGSHWQLWVVGVCVALALGHTVWSAVRKFKRVKAGGSACGGCSGDACGNTGNAGCSTGQSGGAAGGQGAGGSGAAPSVQAQPIHWHPRAGRSSAQPPAD